MLSADQLVPFLLAVALIELTPGPNMAYLALVASRFGGLAGMITVAGVTLGLAIYLALSLFGLAEAALRWPWIYQTLRWAGVAYLVGLAIETWRSASKPLPQPDPQKLFVRGLVNNLLNPKAAVFYVVLLPGFVRADTGRPLMQALTLGGIHICVSVLIHVGIVWGASRATTALASGEALKKSGVLPKTFALGLMAVALWLAFTPQR